MRCPGGDCVRKNITRLKEHLLKVTSSGVPVCKGDSKDKRGFLRSDDAAKLSHVKDVANAMIALVGACLPRLLCGCHPLVLCSSLSLAASG